MRTAFAGMMAVSSCLPITSLPPMRRWVLVILLLVYPFQVALAMADGCCVTTAAGVTHHSAAGADGANGADGADGAATREPVFLADDGVSATADPHCAACVFGHILCLPSDAIVIPAQRHNALAVASTLPFRSAPPSARPERPKWAALAECH